MVRELCPPFDRRPIWKATRRRSTSAAPSTISGCASCCRASAELAPPPRRPADHRTAEVEPTEEPKVSGFVFKIQANMDPNHRDRIAFFRLCSGHFKRGMKAAPCAQRARWSTCTTRCSSWRATGNWPTRPGPATSSASPTTATWASAMRSPKARRSSSPASPPSPRNTCSSVRPSDPLKAKHLGRALQQLAEEGAARVFKPNARRRLDRRRGGPAAVRRAR